jgi:hypothetical protein
MKYAEWVWGAVNWLSLPVIALLAGILVWRKLHREFPFFFAFLVATEIVGLLRFVTFSNQRTYFYVYWISNLFLDVLNLLAVYELFALRLFPRFHKVRIYRFLFAVVGVIIVLAGWLVAIASSNKYRAFIVQDRVFDFIVIGMLAFFVCLMMVMGREWGKYEFGIAFGLVIANVGAILASAMWLRNFYRESVLEEIAPVAFDVACIIWLYCFWSGDKSFDSRVAAPLQQEMVQEARRWEAVLKAWIVPGKRTPGDTK